jgi:hypothetical protein
MKRQSLLLEKACLAGITVHHNFAPGDLGWLIYLFMAFGILRITDSTKFTKPIVRRSQQTSSLILIPSVPVSGSQRKRTEWVAQF